MGAPKDTTNADQLTMIKEIEKIMGDKAVEKEDQNTICTLGKYSASEEMDVHLIDVLNEHMKFQY